MDIPKRFDMADASGSHVTWRDPRKLVSLENLVWFLFIILILAVLYGISIYDYLLFHGIVEIFTIIIAVTIFILVWNNRKIITDTFFLILGISFLFTGIIDLFHTFAYQGMGVFPGSTADLPTQLWIAARYFQSIAILVATFFIGRTITKNRNYDVAIIFATCTAASGLLLASIFVWHDFPQCFVEGTGLTLFKIVSEYIISLILIATTVILYVKRRFFDPEVWRFLIAAQLFLVAGELAFTTYVSVFGFTNMLGHLFKFISFYLFYRAIVVVGIKRPYDLLFRDLVENINDVIYTMDDRGTITYISPSVRRLYGYDPARLRGQDFSSLIEPDDRPSFEEWFRQRKRGETGKNEFRIRTLDGNERSIRTTACQVLRGGMSRGFTCTLTDITDLKRAEAEVRESYQILDTVLNTVTVRVFWKDVHSVYLGCNKPFARDAGFEKPEEIIGKDDFAMSWRDQAERYRADDSAVIGSGTSRLLYEEPQTTPSGDTVYLLTSKVPLRDASGTIIGVLGTYLDITAKKMAEEAQLESEAQLRSILHASPVMQLVIDQDHRIISWNKAIEIYSGIRTEDILGTDGQWRAFYREKRPILADIVLDEALHHIPGAFPGALSRSPVVEDGYEVTDFFPDMGGGGKWLQETAVPILDAKGAVTGAIETIEDITERNLAESALKESEEKYRSLIEYSPYGVLLTHPDGTIISANASACRLLGRTEDEMKKSGRYDIVDVNDPRVAEAVAEREKQGTAIAKEMTFVRKDGSRFEGEVSSTIFLDRHGKPLTSMIFSDITERKRMENSLQMARKEDQPVEYRYIPGYPERSILNCGLQRAPPDSCHR
jgi:PAS domain S-box-containing protein